MNMPLAGRLGCYPNGFKSYSVKKVIDIISRFAIIYTHSAFAAAPPHKGGEYVYR